MIAHVKRNSSKLGIKLISTCKNQMNRRPQQQRIKEHDKAQQKYVQERLERRPADGSLESQMSQASKHLFRIRAKPVIPRK